MHAWLNDDVAYQVHVFIMPPGHSDIVQSTVLSVDSQRSVEIGVVVVRIFLEILSENRDLISISYLRKFIR